MNKNIIAVIDAGGRGAVLIHKYSQNPNIEKILAIPGNDMMQMNSQVPVETYQHLKTTSVKEILEICQKEKVSFVDVAQDNAVAVGLVDELLKLGIQVVGPTQKAGEIEWNKAWSREFMKQHDIPQPEFAVFDSVEKGMEYLNQQPDQKWFVKAAGLAEGKGALPAKNNEEAKERIQELQKFGEAGKTYLLEKWLMSKDGSVAEEFSAFAMSDGKTHQIIGYAQDHKRVFDGDEGENTGGMGCSTPPLVVTDDIQKQVEDIFTKTFTGLLNETREYKGVLYLGGIIIDGKVFIVEFNARWGDPEAEVLVPSIQNDLFEIQQKVILGALHEIKITTDHKARVTVAAASKGYPGDYSHVKGKEIFGIEKAREIPGVTLYGAGVKIKDNKYYVNGGRIFFVVAEGKDVLEARDIAYTAMKMISIEGENLHYRTDIGWRDVERIQN